MRPVASWNIDIPRVVINLDLQHIKSICSIIFCQTHSQNCARALLRMKVMHSANTRLS